MISDLISVIIPVYNVEKYLPECLLSLDNQTNKNFEVIFIDDGSTDKSGQIIDEYAKFHNNAHVIHQANAGVSCAKNAGVKIAQGEYVYFMDSDDFIHPQTLDIYFNTIKSTNADVVTSGFYFKKETIEYQKTKFKNICNPKVIFYNDKDEFFSRYLASHKNSYFFLGGHNKLYKTAILQKISTYPDVFNKELSYGEDSNLVCKYLLNANSLACVHERFYFYRQRQNSILHSGFYEKLLTVLQCLDPLSDLDSTLYPKTVLQRNQLQCVYALEMLFRMSKCKYSNLEVIDNVYKIYRSNLKYCFKAKHTVWYHKWFLWCTIFYIKPMVLIKHKKYSK